MQIKTGDIVTYQSPAAGRPLTVRVGPEFLAPGGVQAFDYYAAWPLGPGGGWLLPEQVLYVNRVA